MARGGQLPRLVRDVLIPLAGVAGFFTSLAFSRQLGPYAPVFVAGSLAMMGLVLPLRADEQRQRREDRERDS